MKCGQKSKTSDKTTNQNEEPYQEKDNNRASSSVGFEAFFYFVMIALTFVK